MVQAGDSIPSVELVVDNPGNKIDLSKELATGKGLIIGKCFLFFSLSETNS
jgi:hypothetical protein